MRCEEIDIPGGEAFLLLGFLEEDYSKKLFNSLLSEIDWEQRCVVICGKEIPQPRKVAWYGDYSYTYSGITWLPKAWTPLLWSLTKEIEEITGAQYNGVLLNLYENGSSSIGMHSDDEPEFGSFPIIASLSLGSERIFKFQRKDKSLDTVKIPLPHGSILIMRGSTQELYKHGIDKTKEDVGPRINLTFRHIVNPQIKPGEWLNAPSTSHAKS